LKTLLLTTLALISTACGQLVAGVSDFTHAPSAPAALSLTSSSNVNLGTLAVTALSAPQAFVFHNSGAATATGCTAPALSNASDFLVVSTTCGATLAAGASCTSTVRGQPSATGASTSTLTYTCSNAGNTLSVVGNISQTATPTLSGAGYATSSFYSPATIGSASVDVQTISINNYDAVNFTSCTPYLENTTDFTVVGASNTCGSTLAPGSSCSFDVTATPTALGAHTSKVGLNCLDSGLFLYNGGSTPLTVTGGMPSLAWNQTSPFAMNGTVSGNNSGNVAYLQVQNQTSSADATNCHSPVITGDTSQFSIDATGFNNDLTTASGTMGHFVSFGNIVVESAPTAPGNYSITLTYTCDNNLTAGASTATLVVNMTATP
jgi:hypothetical protein